MTTPDTPKAQTPNAQGDALREAAASALEETNCGSLRSEWVEVRRSALDRLEAALASSPAPVGDRLAIRMLVAAGFVTESKANEALQIAHGFVPGPLESSPAPVGEADSFAWTNRKPTRAGAYGVRGYELFVSPQEQFEAIVAVRRNDEGELVCNLHANTTEEDFDLWYPVAVLKDDLEWLEFTPAMSSRPEGQGDRDA